MNRNIYLDGMMGLIVGDALGVPYEFSPRRKLKKDPAVDMIGYGTHNVPAGSWSDDSSMALATLDSLRYGYDPKEIMMKFSDWYHNAKYTPSENVFDIGITCTKAIKNYDRSGDISSCGCGKEADNGNGSLMRILPACLYFYEKNSSGAMAEKEILEKIHEVSALTHAHLRSKIACGLYYFLVKEILDGSGSLNDRLQKGFDDGSAFYGDHLSNRNELSYYDRMKSISRFAALPDAEIEGSGYVVASFEAAVWCLANTSDYRSCVLKAVNLGKDTDTVAAIAGGLAGLYYGYDSIPSEWKAKIIKREWIENMCREM